MTSDEKGALGDFLDTTNPVLTDFRSKCPGTYKHCQYLSAMVEGVSASLDLNINEMKVAALYHDIGKIVHPMYFSENQPKDKNVHDTLDPWTSYQLISRHVSDGVNILINLHEFPRRLIEIISQHHGTLLIKCFAAKVQECDANMYRYRGSTPKTLEAAVLMLCDQIEAISRALSQKASNDFNPEEVIDTTIRSLEADGQLDIMKVGEVRRVREALLSESMGLSQKRVDYEKEIEESKKTKKPPRIGEDD